MGCKERIVGWAVCLGLSFALLVGCSGGGGGDAPPSGAGATAPAGAPSAGGGGLGGVPSAGSGVASGGGGAAAIVGAQEAYIKASNSGFGDLFGAAIALSADGNTLAVAAVGESSAAGVNGDQTDNTLGAAGAVYVLVRSGATWVQQAYIKASNPDAGDEFGTSVALSADGDTLVVGAPGESSAGGGNQADNAAPAAGAAYVFIRSGTTWTQQAYIKASNPQVAAEFGISVALSGDGDMLAVGAQGESGAATGIDGNQANNTAPFAGAVYMFVRSGGTWTQQTYVKASNASANDLFGAAVALSADGGTLAVGALGEASAATGIAGDQANNAAPDAGAAYVFVRSGTSWVQQAYVKASNAGEGDFFGVSLSLSADGNTLAVGAPREDRASSGINGEPLDDTAVDAGAAYVFVRSASTWSQQSYVKASNTGVTDSGGFGELFGAAVALSQDGNVLAVGAPLESGDATGIGGDHSGDTFLSGATYVFSRAGSTWAQDAYVKASNTALGSLFGFHVALNGAGSELAVGALGEAGAATGINGDQTANPAFAFSGAAYVFR